MKTKTITRDQVIRLAQTMPQHKLASWYEYGLFIQLHAPLGAASASEPIEDAELAEELAAWEAASDEDWLKTEQMLAESN